MTSAASAKFFRRPAASGRSWVKRLRMSLRSRAFADRAVIVGGVLLVAFSSMYDIRIPRDAGGEAPMQACASGAEETCPSH